ncbi:hypothetical protein [Chthonomonas calidirosea]|uniref:hypothetical protein n=1 Tax=Chthonomonas calidirosea TaxID=454171 RepID=UPI000A524E1E|nr:hypothetical protein [Chthonomonas calidirosea]
MNKQVSPVIVAIVVVVVVIVLGFWLYKAMQPSYYPPSPGVAGNPAAPVPNYGQPSQSNTQSDTRGGTPAAPPPNAIPGAPPGYTQPTGGSK